MMMMMTTTLGALSDHQREAIDDEQTVCVGVGI